MATESALSFLRGMLEGRRPARLVLISGPQTFLREYVLEALHRHFVRDGFNYRTFQVSASDGFGGIISELETADLFAPTRLVICRVLRSYRERGSSVEEEPRANAGSGGEKGGDASLIGAMDRMPAMVQLILIYERDNAPAKVRRFVEQTGLVITCMRPFDNQVRSFVELFAQHLGITLSTSDTELLVATHGFDLAAIANTLSKAAMDCDTPGKIDDLRQSTAIRVPDLFELAESLARGDAGETLALFDRAIQTGRDPIELLAVEVIPLLRRMLTAAVILARRKGTSEVAVRLGLPPNSLMMTRALEGARHFGIKRLERAHRRACELDAHFKMGLLKERAHAVAAMLIELMAD